MTISNIPKSLCSKPLQLAQVLIGYIPISKLHGLSNKAAQYQAVANLFHIYMCDVLHPIVMPGESGIPIISGDSL